MKYVMVLLMWLHLARSFRVLHKSACARLHGFPLCAGKRVGGSEGGEGASSGLESPQSWEMGPPPDLPSLLLSNRIVYLGSPIVPSVSELIVAQLLFLNHQGNDLITMYINSAGTNAPDGRHFSFDTEAFAIADTMLFVRPPIRTICVGQAFGTAAMLLSLGQKGNRMSLPHASIMLAQPRARSVGTASDIVIKAREVACNRKVTNEFLARACGKDLATIQADTNRARYFTAEEGVDYGIIDKVLHPKDLMEMDKAARFVESL